MMLGEVLAAARKSGSGMEDWLARAEPEIWAALGEAAEAEGVALPIRDARDPGQACLLSMITWRLRKPTSSCGHNH